MTANDGKLYLTGQNATLGLADFTNGGYWLVQDGSITNLGGTLFTNNGTFNVGGYTGGSGWGRVRLIANVQLSGTGDLLLSPGIIDSPLGFPLTNADGQSIHGRGEINSSVINNATVLADQGGIAQFRNNHV